MQVKNNYEQTYYVVRPMLQNCDFNYAVKNLGFSNGSSGAQIITNFLGHDFIIDHEDVRLAKTGDEVNTNFKSVLVYYVCSTSGIEPTNDFALLSSFSHGIFSSGTNAEPDWNTRHLRKKCGERHEQFKAAAKKLGMKYLGLCSTQTHLWETNVLPKIPLRIKYFEKDDEFPCDVKLYFDKNVLSYLGFETAAVLQGCVVEALTAACTHKS